MIFPPTYADIGYNIDELAELETLDQGKPLFVGRWAEIPGAVNQFRYFAGRAMALEGRGAKRIEALFPFGVEGTSDWLRAAAKAFGVDPALTEQVLAPGRERARIALSKLRPQLEGKRPHKSRRLVNHLPTRQR